MTEEISISPKCQFRVTILVGHSLESPLPEAIEMLKGTVNYWMNSQLEVEIRADIATLPNFQREARRGCDLFIFYGHGNDTGYLQFADGSYDVNQLDEKEFWQHLSGCIIFACHGQNFAKNLPCPWISFSASIFRQAPVGFMSAWISKLKDNSLSDALDFALEMCRAEMKSEFPSICTISKNLMPNIKIPSGEPYLSRFSPGLSNKCRLDYVDFGAVNISYPEHDPFVGRLQNLKSLLNLPHIHGDETRQRVVWIWGDAGMGKSALLRQFAYVVRDQLFQEHDEPLSLFQMNCWNYTQSMVCDEKDSRDLERDLIKNLKRFYHIKGEFQSLPELIQKLEETKGTHVWILDDLTYLSSRIESNEEAVKFIAGIIEAAKVSAVTLQIVTSTRHPYPNYHKKWDNLKVLPLSETEVIELAKTLLPEDYIDTKLERGAILLFKTVQYSTALYKRSLINAINLHISYLDYAFEMSKTGLENLDAEEFIRCMGTFESSQLLKLEPIHGFRYSEFLKIYYPLTTRSGWFAQNELKAWFGSLLVSESSRISEDVAYENGLRYLVRLNYLAAKDQGDGDIVFYMPPNQRSLMRAVRDLAWTPPDSIPLRGVRERLSLCIERIKNGSNTEVQELLEMEQDYRQEIKKPEALNAIFLAMHIRAQIEITFHGDLRKSIEIYDETVSIFNANKDGSAGNVETDNLIATALYNKGATLGKLGKSEEEIAEYDLVVKWFGGRDDTVLVERVAAALNNKGLALGDLGKLDEAIISFDEVITRCKNRNETIIVEKVVSSLSNKGVILNKLGKSVEALEIYDGIVSRYGSTDEVTVAEKIANALYNKGYALDEQGKFEEAIVAFSTLVVRFGGYDELPIARRVATAMVSIGIDLSKLQRSKDALSIFDDILECFGDSDDSIIADDVARALVAKGIEFFNLGNFEDAIVTFDHLVMRFRNRKETAIIEKITSALNYKGQSLNILGKTEDAIVVYKLVFSQYGDREEPIIAEKVAMALVNIGVILGNRGKFEDSIAVNNLVITRFVDQYDALVAEKVAIAYLNIGTSYGKIGNFNEEIAAYDTIASKFCERCEIPLMEKVASALYNKGHVLNKMGRKTDAIKVYDYISIKFGGRKDDLILIQVAKALFNKGVILLGEGKLEEAIAVFDQVIVLFCEKNETEFKHQVSQAMVNKGAALERQGMLENALESYNILFSRYCNSEETAILKSVAIALWNKCQILFKKEKYEEEIATYDLIVTRFSSEMEKPFPELTIMALSNKCETLEILKRFEEREKTLDLIINNFPLNSQSEIIFNLRQKAVEKRDSIKK
jgi:tetratricopeptide (TPR) repeat protein